MKWVCGFANAYGGTIYIGINDDGEVIGAVDYKKLLDELPNKIRDILGIIVEVNLRKKNDLFYLQILVSPYTVPISVRGRYYYRSGSTKQELTGTALNDFLLRKSGRTWDDIVEPMAKFNDIDSKSLEKFKADALISTRLAGIEDLTTEELLLKLRLIDDNGRIKRSAIVLFGKDAGKFYPNMIVKTGRFGKSDDDLRFQEIAEGNLMHLLQLVQEQLNNKFFTHPIDYKGLQRIERGEYPVAAIREMLLNALIHRNYLGTSVQIRMYDDKFTVWNEGFLPEGLSLESLKRQHPSRPRNPIIADVCFKGGYIDAWGRGTLKILDACKEAGLPEPIMKEQDGGFLVTLFKDIFNEENLQKFSLSKRQIVGLSYTKENGNITNRKYQELNDVSERTALRDLEELVGYNLLHKIGLKKGTSYRLVGE